MFRANDANSSRDSRKDIARTSQTCRAYVAKSARDRRKGIANVANLSQRVARMSQSGRAKASRDIPAMLFSATISAYFSAYFFISVLNYLFLLPSLQQKDCRFKPAPTFCRLSKIGAGFNLYITE